MSHKTLIGGTAYNISKGKTMIGGVVYAVTSGIAKVAETARSIVLKSYTVAITGTGVKPFSQYSTTYRSAFWHIGGAVFINGTQYYSANTLTVKAGTTVRIGIKGGKALNSRDYWIYSYCNLYVDGTSVLSSGNTDGFDYYDITATSNMTIQLAYAMATSTSQTLSVYVTTGA